MVSSVSLPNRLRMADEMITDALVVEQPATADLVGVSLMSLATPDSLLALLREIRDHDVIARSVASQSFSHPLGFDKILLLDHKPHFQLRLHIWWPGVARGHEHVHNHRYALWSVIVCGRLRTAMYQKSSCGQQMTELADARDKRTEEWRFQRVGSTSVERCVITDMAAGSSYALSADVFHRIDASDADLTMTLFLETAWVRNQTTVFLESWQHLPVPSVRQVFTVPDLQHRLNLAAAGLGDTEQERLAG